MSLVEPITNTVLESIPKSCLSVEVRLVEKCSASLCEECKADDTAQESSCPFREQEDPRHPGVLICQKIDWNWMFTIAVILLAVWATLAFYASYQGYKLFVKLASGDQVATTQEATSSAYEMEPGSGDVTFGKPVAESATPKSSDDIEMGKPQQRHGSSASVDSGVL
ncbi:hypothetical protein FOZ61_007546 [Perkinsus olseni]|uniref:Uncharacterized protein n=1 Tax=Perkinsus olseni TaxID=32597 RepID=A0A7J6L8K0_PEROL|nr:hypothetical protein FOZ61_007546 [Perkinsus olseni]